MVHSVYCGEFADIQMIGYITSPDVHEVNYQFGAYRDQKYILTSVLEQS